MAPTQAQRLLQASQHRREDEKHAVRRAILNAARDVFLEQGYAGFSLRPVAERIGYSATTIYRYFADKDDLLFTIVDDGFLQFGEQLHAVAASTADARVRLHALLRAYLTFGLTNPVYYQLMFLQRGDFLTSYRQGERHPRIDSFRILEDTVEAAIAVGAIPCDSDAAQVADVIWATMHGIVALHLSLPSFSLDRALATAEHALRWLIPDPFSP